MSIKIIVLTLLIVLTARTGFGKKPVITTKEEDIEAFKECTKSALVVSEVFCLPSDYRKDVPPPIDGPIMVVFKIPVSELSKIDDQRSQISIRWTYKLKWPEPRMLLNATADWSTGEINVRGDMVDHFWTPDIIIHDLVSFYKPEILNQVAALEIKKKKQLYFKVRSDMTMVCKGMKFSRFPLDEHVCYLKLTSFGYDDRRMMLGGSFTYDSENQRALPFTVKIKELSDAMKVFAGSSSNYSVYGLEIRLARCVSPYLLNVYLPTAIFVVMSWVSFLIPTDVVPARIVLLITLCLVIINTFNNVTARIPVASQVTALEIWLLACILLVFGALAEYAFILRQVINLTRKQRRLRERHAQKMQDSGQLLSSYSSPPAVFPPGASLTSNSTTYNAPTSSGHGRNGAQNPLKPQQDNIEHWPMKTFPTANNTRDTTVTSQKHSHGHVHHHHNRMGDVHTALQPHPSQPQVSLETHQTEKGGPNTTIAATTHHLHECEDETLSLTHRSVGICTMSKKSEKHSNRGNSHSHKGSPPNNSKEMSGNYEGIKVTKTHEQLLRRYQEHVDGKALIIFPIAFFLFNIGYWSHYLINVPNQ